MNSDKNNVNLLPTNGKDILLAPIIQKEKKRRSNKKYNREKYEDNKIKNIKKSSANVNGNDITDQSQQRDDLHNPSSKPIPNHNYGITENAKRNQIILVKCKY
jgi:hypothetical protein